MASTPIDAPLPRAATERSLYTWGAIAALLVAFAGFAPTYYLKGVFGGRELSAMIHLHGVVMTAWFALFLVQARLVATGHTALHRKLGMAGAVLAAAVVGMGLATAIASVRLGSTPVGMPPLVFLVMPLGEVVTFTVLIGAALALRKRAAWHKRLMLAAAIAILTPAMARITKLLELPGAPITFFVLVDLLLLACIAYDTWRNRRLHPAFAAGFAVVLFVQAGRLALAQTEAWMGFAKWLVA